MFCPTGHQYELTVTEKYWVNPYGTFHGDTFSGGFGTCKVETNYGFRKTSDLLSFKGDRCRHWGIEQWFNHVCQSHVRSHLNGCELDWNNSRYGCSSFMGPSLESRGYKPACIIHDMCYESGRPKSRCDYAFRDNLGELGMEYIQRHIVYAAVRDHGKIRDKKTC